MMGPNVKSNEFIVVETVIFDIQEDKILQLFN